jgi:outer membrane protein OmpA-like peptidoglycan-associated protein/ABC-type taurine transport system substrate-binding protein
MAERFEPNAAQCMWRTIDFWSQEQPALRSVQLDGQMVMIVDNSRGGDAIIGRSGSIESVEDLAGKQVATTEFTPSHMFAIYAVNNSSMSRRARESVALRPFGSNADALAAFKAGQVDALVTWEPETSLALTTVPGATRVFDTSQATSLIYDGIVCNNTVINQNPDVVQRFVTGWLAGAEEANANPRKGAEVLVAAEPMFASLVEDQGMDFLVDEVFKGIRWTTLEDNIRVFGLAGGGNTFERIYTESDDIWRENTNLLDGMPRVNVNDAYTTKFVSALMDTAPQAKKAAQVPEFTFTAAERAEVVKADDAALTKSLQINFATGKSTLNKKGEATLDEVVSLLDATSGAYVMLSGNTDSTGGKAVNQRLSTERAKAAATYLVNEWEVPADRLEVVGNGSSDPLCNEKDPASSGYDSLDECRAANRTTRITILGSGR